MASSNDKLTVFRALVGAGFTPLDVQPAPNYHLFKVSRTELLGSKVCYMIAVASHRLSNSDVEWLVKEAHRQGKALVLVGETDARPEDVPVLSYAQFLDRLGGPVFSLLPLDDAYAAHLVTLGHNTLPVGMIGRPDDLFEQYVYAGLQYLFRARVVRYGQDRRFEPVPDGIAIGNDIPLMLYDAKAAAKGYEMSMDAVRQFSDYVEEFNRCYETQVGKVGYFLVISGSFDNEEDALEERSRDVQAKTGVPLSFLTADVLGSIVKRLVQEPFLRPTLNWRRIFARPVVRLQDVEKQLRARNKDGVLPKMEGS